MKQNKESKIVSNLINKWINIYLPSRGIVSSHTIQNYRLSLIILFEFLEDVKEINISTLTLNCFNYNILEEWVVWLKEQRENSPSTCNLRLSAIRSFLKYIAHEDITLSYLYHNAISIPLMKITKHKVKGISQKAMKVLLDQPNIETPTGRFYLTLLVTMYNTGVRIDEILSLKIKNVNFLANIPQIIVIGKGNKIRTLPLHKRTVALLKRYIHERHGYAPCPDSYVFYSKNAGPQGKMTQNAVNKQLKKYAVMAHETCYEIPITLHMHQIRHTSVCHWLESGLNIVQISKMLGHNNISTTELYLDISDEFKEKELNKIRIPETKNIKKKWKSNKNLASICKLTNPN